MGNFSIKKWRRESALDVYNLLLALFLLVAPWLFARANGTAAIDLRASGAAIALLSLAAMVAFATWEEWANLMLGIWLIGSPWLLDFAHTRAMHFSIGAGAAVAFLAALELWLVYDAAHPEPPPRAHHQTEA
jgi:SPW repeat